MKPNKFRSGDILWGNISQSYWYVGKKINNKVFQIYCLNFIENYYVSELDDSDVWKLLTSILRESEISD